MARHILVLLITVLLSHQSNAQWHDRDGNILKDEPAQKSVGTFGAMLLITTDPDAALAAWEKPASPDYRPQVKTTSAAVRGDIVTGIFIFSGCMADKTANCNVDADIKVVSPDGSTYGEFPKVEIWQGKPSPGNKTLQLGMAQIGIRFEPQDQLGVYQLQAHVRDNVSRAKMDLVQTITLGATKN
jgi:hypothetical protein